jgi:hypothetical protein
MDEAFDTLVGVCGELGAKLSNIDTLEHELDGKSKTNWKMWGRKFHARVIKDPSGIHIEVYDFALLPNDLFIKELYNTFMKYTSASPLAIDFFVKVFHALRKGDVRFSGDERTMRIEESGEPMPGGGAPLIIVDHVCSKCGASNEPESAFCTKCGGSMN